MSHSESDSESEEDRALATHFPAPPNAIPLPFNSLLLLVTYLPHMYEARAELLVLAPVCKASLRAVQQVTCKWVRLWQQADRAKLQLEQDSILLFMLLHWGLVKRDKEEAMLRDVFHLFAFYFKACSRLSRHRILK